jgi:Kdo2-lipid IVA lauroyltransferase/acyltransferase
MTLVQKLHLVLLKVFILIVRALPRSAAVSLGRFTGLLSATFIPLHRKIAEVQMRHALGAGYDDRHLRESFMHQGGLFFDMVKCAYMSDDELKSIVINEGRKHLDNALASGRHIIIVSGHMNWEIVGNTPRLFGIEIHVMADYIKNPAVQAIADKIRAQYRIDVLPPRGGMVNTYLNNLKAGRIMALVIDQRGKRENRLFCDVLGLPAPTNPAPAFIALKGDAIILPLVGFRRGDKYVFRWYEPIDSRDFGTDYNLCQSLNDCWKSSAVRGLSCAINAWLSSVIRESPDQWFWLHCRWVRRSDMAKVVRKNLDFGQYVRSQVDSYLSRENVV